MRTGMVCLMLVGASVFSAGCAWRRAPASGPGAGVFGESELESRFQAAAGIADLATRDQALANVALRAADAGDGRITLLCLNAMRLSPARDEAGYQCAVTLARVGWMQQAVTVAQMIGDSSMRDRALARVAEFSAPQ